jgi:hypothetical protein
MEWHTLRGKRVWGTLSQANLSHELLLFMRMSDEATWEKTISR